MQLKPIDASSIVPSTELADLRNSTTQDGIHQPAPSSLDGSSQPRARCLSPGSRDSATTLFACGVGADELDSAPQGLSIHDAHATVPGSRISAYENAATPTGHQNALFKFVKQSGSGSGGPSLGDCSNGMMPNICCW